MTLEAEQEHPITWPKTNREISRRSVISMASAIAAGMVLVNVTGMSGDLTVAYAATGWRHPFDKRTSLGDYWQKIRSYGTSPHNGVDYVPRDTGAYQVLAARPGTVNGAGYDSGRGYWARINHGSFNGATWTTQYLHFSGPAAVVNGQYVGIGARLGTMGQTGATTGRHTHIDMTRNGVPIDSWPYLGNAADLSNSPGAPTTQGASDMYILQDTAVGGGLYLAAPGELLHIQNPTHLAPLNAMVNGGQRTFNLPELKIITGYMRGFRTGTVAVPA